MGRTQINGGTQIQDATITLAKINATNAANELVSLNSTGQLPAVDGSLLLDLSAAQVGLGNVTNDTQLKASQLSTDGTMIADSTTLVPSQSAVVTYVGTAISNLPVPYVPKGTIDCSSNPNYPAANAGWVWIISVAGKIGGVSGLPVSAGDQLICLNTNAGGTQAGVGSNFDVLQVSIANATLQGNTFNGNSQLVQTNSTGQLPAVDGSLLLDLSAAQVGLGNVTNDAQLKASQLSTDGTFASPSNTTVPSTQAVSTYVSSQIATIPAQKTAFRDIFVPTTGQTTFTLTHTPVAYTDDVYVNGDLAAPSASYDYTLSGTTLTFNYGLLATDLVVVRYSY